MLTSCWSIKGGVGTTVVSALLGLQLARRREGDVLVVDLDGDVAVVLGIDVPGGPGIGEWLDADDVPPDALARLEVDAQPGLSLLPGGVLGPVEAGRADRLAAQLAHRRRPVVADCGVIGRPGHDDPLRRSLVARADRSLLIVTNCYLAVRRARTVPSHPDGIVLLSDRDRRLGRRDVEDAVGAPVVAEVRIDRAVARAIDRGLLTVRLPRGLERALQDAA